MKVLFRNGKILVDPESMEWVDWLLVEDGQVSKYGFGEPVDIEYDDVIDLRGGYAYPGFIDCHIHLFMYGFSLKWIDLRGVKSFKELRDRLVNSGGVGFKGWILGRGWDQDKMVEKRYPDRYFLDSIYPEKPVYLKRVCGHIAVANSVALKIAGVVRDTPDPPGGVIDRDEDGEPTGVLRERAMELVEKSIPQPDLDDYIDAGLDAVKDLLSKGVTTVHLVSATPVEWTALKKMYRGGELCIRVRVYFDYRYFDWLLENTLHIERGDDGLRVMGIKIITDGSLGGRTAALREDYSDEPGNKGVLIVPFNKLREVVKKAFTHDLQLAIHGIGDRAIENIIDVLSGRPSGRRDRVEHASVMSPDLITRMAEEGIIASVQPQFITSDTWTVDRLGPERARYTYPFKTMIKNGILLGGGSDAPVEIPDPLMGMYSAVTRGVDEGNPLAKYTLEERLSIEEAINLYTSWAAYLSYEENKLGKLREGYFADMVVMEKALEDIDAFRSNKVLMTVVGGRVLWSS